jgi:group I intron endonuclease
MLIYLITNTINGKQYIGQTLCTPEKRWREHVYNASGNKQRSAYPLYHAIRKYGAAAFCISTLDAAQSQEELNQKEIEYIEAYQTLSREFGYNRHEGGNKPPSHTPESRAKAAKSNTGQKRTEETKQRMSHAQKGKPKKRGYRHSEESIRRMSESQKERCRLRGGSRLGLKSSPEHCQRISAALTGKKASEETRRKLSLVHTNPSDEARQNMSRAHLGKPWSAKRRAAWEAKKKSLLV